jgi:hypothetical protein
MSRSTNDPLLTTASLLLGLFIGLLGFAMVLVAIGVGAVLTVQRGEIVADIAAEGLAAGTYWGIVAGLVAVVAMLFLALRFTLELRSIVASVQAGDPFVAENAAHLARMGWLALAIQLIAIPVGIAAAAAGELTENGADVGTSGGGFVLVLTLFILARVFRRGTEMREELEGTV